MLGDLKIQATEITPKDIYQMDVYNVTKPRPQQCIDADPTLPYCQILGKYRFELPGYSSIALYDNMNNHCESVGPAYYRPPGC